MKDFGGRCAYSLQNPDLFGGLRSMEVDHFDPRKKKDHIQEYDNLVPASRHCNGSKGDSWPTASEQKLGIRFIHPRFELDYGPHIVEEKASGKLKGLTPAGKWQIRMCGLNAEHLVRERLRRTKLIQILEKKDGVIIFESYGSVAEAIAAMRKEISLMIPEIPESSD